MFQHVSVKEFTFQTVRTALQRLLYLGSGVTYGVMLLWYLSFSTDACFLQKHIFHWLVQILQVHTTCTLMIIPSWLSHFSTLGSRSKSTVLVLDKNVFESIAEAITRS